MIRAIRVCTALLAVAGLLVACAGAASAEDYDPWMSLKVGDWAKYKSSPVPNMESHSKWTVKEVTDTKVVYEVETTTMMDGKQLGEPTKTEMTYEKKKPAGGEAEIYIAPVLPKECRLTTAGQQQLTPGAPGSRRVRIVGGMNSERTFERAPGSRLRVVTRAEGSG